MNGMDIYPEVDILLPARVLPGKPQGAAAFLRRRRMHGGTKIMAGELGRYGNAGNGAGPQRGNGSGPMADVSTLHTGLLMDPRGDVSEVHTSLLSLDTPSVA